MRRPNHPLLAEWNPRRIAAPRYRNVYTAGT